MSSMDANRGKKRTVKKKPKLGPPTPKFVPHSPGGQNLRPAPKQKVQPRTRAQKQRGKRVIERASKAPQDSVTKQVVRLGKAVSRVDNAAARARIIEDSKKLGPPTPSNRSKSNRQRTLDRKAAASPLGKRKAKEDREPYKVLFDPKASDQAQSNAKVKLRNKGVLPSLDEINPPKLEKKLGGGTIPKKKGGVEQFAAGAITLASGGNPINSPALAIAKNPKGAGKTALKMLENSARSAVDMPANVIPSAVHIGKPIYDEPGKLKSYGKTAERVGEAAISLPKEFIKDPGGTAVKRPLEIGLLAAPVPRLPGIARGGVARRKGNMPQIEDRHLPGTAMKQQVVRSKSYYKAKRQAKEGKQEIIEKTPSGTRNAIKAVTGGRIGATHSVIENRVDAQVALMEGEARRVQSKVFRKTYKNQKKVVGRKEAATQAKQLAEEAQAKVRKEYRRDIAEGMSLLEKPKTVPTGRGHFKVVKPASMKAQVFTAGDAARAAERYNAKHNVQMEPYKVEGGYTVMPASGIKRLAQHEADTEVNVLGAAAKGYNTMWRKNVLATHATWYAGNIIEAAMRSAVSGVGPTAYYRGYKTLAELKRIDPKAYDRAVGHIAKGGHMNMSAHLPGETKIDIQGHGFIVDTARKMQSWRDNPHGPKQVADVWTNFTDLTMGTLSGGVESFFQVGMLGKELARNPLMDGHTKKVSKAAIAEAAKGMRETHNQIALGEAVDRMYGQYGKWSPGKRKMIAHYTPFIAWTLNSLNFLYRYLPKDHPVLTAAVASSQPYVEEWLKDKGLSAFVKGALPSFLRGSIPAEKGYARFPTRYTPMSVAAGFPESLAGAVLPQADSILNLAKHGINWKGQKLKNPDGTPLDPWQQVVLSSLYLLEGFVPASQQTVGPAQKYEEGARTPKKVFKPNTAGEAAGNILNPFKLVPKQKSQTKEPKSFYKTTGKKAPSFYDTKKKKEKSFYDSP